MIRKSAHNSFVTPAVDKQKMRDSAQARLDKEGVTTTIHLHEFLEPCAKFEHEYYPPLEEDHA